MTLALLNCHGDENYVRNSFLDVFECVPPTDSQTTAAITIITNFISKFSKLLDQAKRQGVVGDAESQ